MKQTKRQIVLAIIAAANEPMASAEILKKAKKTDPDNVYGTSQLCAILSGLAAEKRIHNTLEHPIGTGKKARKSWAIGAAPANETAQPIEPRTRVLKTLHQGACNYLDRLTHQSTATLCRGGYQPITYQTTTHSLNA